MSVNTERAWPSILAAVKQPLGFFTLVALITDGLLGGGALTGRVPWQAPVALLVIVLVLFSGVVIFKPDALYAPGPKTPLTISLVFPPETRVQLAVEKCTIEVRDLEGKPREPKIRTANLTQDVAKIWSVRLGSDVRLDDSVRLELIDEDGERWRVNPFLPYVNTQQPVRVSGKSNP